MSDYMFLVLVQASVIPILRVFISGHEAQFGFCSGYICIV